MFLGQELLLDCELCDAASLFEGRWSRRTWQGLVQRLMTASNRCTSIVEKDLKDKASALAEKLLNAAEDIETSAAVLDTARLQGHTLVKSSVREPSGQRVFRSMPASTGGEVFTAIASAAIMRVTPQTLDVVTDLVAFLDADMSTVKTELSLSMLALADGGGEEKAASLPFEVQSSSVVNLVDRFFSTLSGAEFVKAVGVIGESRCCPVSHGKHCFSPREGDRLPAEDGSGWCAQGLVDLSLCFVMARVLEREETNNSGKDVQLAGDEHRVLDEREGSCIFEVEGVPGQRREKYREARLGADGCAARVLRECV